MAKVSRVEIVLTPRATCRLDHCSFERGLVGWWLAGWWAGELWSSAIHFENNLICLVQSARAHH